MNSLSGSVAKISNLNCILRYQDFLLLDEYKFLKISDSSIIQSVPPSESVEEQECFIACNETTIGWNSASSDSSLTTPKDDEITLERISFTVRMGQMMAIIGHVGSGKVSFV